MRRLALILGLLLVAAPLGGQQTPVTVLAWDLDATHDPASVTWEVETASGIVPCVSPQVTATDRRCSATFPRTTSQSIRLRGTNGSAIGEWSAAITAPAIPAGQAPGVLTITWVGELPTSGGAMAWTHVSNGDNLVSEPGGIPDATQSFTFVNAQAGDVPIIWSKFEGTEVTQAGDINGVDALSIGGDGDHSNGDMYGDFLYHLGITQTGTITVNITLSTARPWWIIRAMLWRPPAGATVSLDGVTIGQGTGTALTSGNIATTGTDVIAIGSNARYSSLTLSAMLINGQTPDQTNNVNNTAVWAEAFSSPFTGGAAATHSVSDAWLCGVIAFKAVAAGGRASKNTRSHPLGVNVGMGWRMPV